MKQALLAFGVALVLLVPQSVRAKPYAPTPKIPKGYDSIAGKQMMEEVKKNIPDASKLEAPAYPDALAVSLISADNGLQSVTLMSTDAPAKIVAWYKKKLPGWKFKAPFGVSWVFWKGAKDDFAIIAPKVPHVMIVEVEEGTFDAKLTPKGKTRISVYYGVMK